MNNIVTEVVVYFVIWILYSVVEGIREAYYFNSNPSPTKFNIHILFTIQRLLVISLIPGLTHWLVLIPCVFSFPFFHDGAYYMGRHFLNPSVYPKGFWDNPSPTSTAKLDFKLWERLVMMIFSLVSLYIILTIL